MPSAILSLLWSKLLRPGLPPLESSKTAEGHCGWVLLTFGHSEILSLYSGTFKITFS